MTATVRAAAPRRSLAQRGAAVGEPAGERPQQRLIDRRHFARDAVERRAIELEHDRIARRDDRRSARSAGEEAGLADRLADADLGDGALLAFDPDFEAAGDHDVDGVRRRVLPNEDFAAEQIVNLRARPDRGQLIVRQLAEDRRRAQQYRRVQGARFVCHGGPPVPCALAMHLCRPACRVRQILPAGS